MNNITLIRASVTPIGPYSYNARLLVLVDGSEDLILDCDFSSLSGALHALEFEWAHLHDTSASEYDHDEISGHWGQ